MSYNSLLNVIDKAMIDIFQGKEYIDSVVDYIKMNQFNFTFNVADLLIVISVFGIVVGILYEMYKMISIDKEEDEEENQMFRPIKIKSKVQRLDKHLVETLNLSRSKITHMISNGNILINDEVARKPGLELEVGDIISYKASDIDENLSLEPYAFDLKILFEDDSLLVVYKPSGMLSHPTQHNEKDTLMNALKYYSKDKFVPLMVHRLDKDTSGLLIFAKNEQAQSKLLEMMQARKIVKKYYTIVNGKVTKDNALINVPICRANDNKLKMVAGEGKNPKEALTGFEVIKRWETHTLLDITLHTGRTHQIRVHMKYINHPIVNDPLYSFNRYESTYHQYLMAYALKFNHPITKKVVNIKIDYDNEFKSIIKDLDEFKIV
ncbi:MAG: RluA family pseudouridine synthase [Mycoplasma sp.]